MSHTDREHLVRRVADLLGLPPGELAPDADLGALGLCSLDVMRVVNEWRVRGVPVTFAELAAEPTIEGWSRRIDTLCRANPYLRPTG